MISDAVWFQTLLRSQCIAWSQTLYDLRRGFNLKALHDLWRMSSDVASIPMQCMISDAVWFRTWLRSQSIAWSQTRYVLRRCIDLKALHDLSRYTVSNVASISWHGMISDAIWFLTWLRSQSIAWSQTLNDLDVASISKHCKISDAEWFRLCFDLNALHDLKRWMISDVALTSMHCMISDAVGFQTLLRSQSIAWSQTLNECRRCFEALHDLRRNMVSDVASISKHCMISDARWFQTLLRVDFAPPRTTKFWRLVRPAR